MYRTWYKGPGGKGTIEDSRGTFMRISARREHGNRNNKKNSKCLQVHIANGLKLAYRCLFSFLLDSQVGEIEGGLATPAPAKAVELPGTY